MLDNVKQRTIPLTNNSHAARWIMFPFQNIVNWASQQWNCACFPVTTRSLQQCFNTVLKILIVQLCRFLRDNVPLICWYISHKETGLTGMFVTKKMCGVSTRNDITTFKARNRVRVLWEVWKKSVAVKTQTCICITEKTTTTWGFLHYWQGSFQKTFPGYGWWHLTNNWWHLCLFTLHCNTCNNAVYKNPL